MDDLSEKEQIELMRNWWRENGNYAIAGIVLGVAVILGINFWQDSQRSLRVDASTAFEALAEEVADNRVEQAETLAADLLASYGDTIYADQARLAMARLYMDQGRDQDAANELRQLVDSGNSEEMKLIARLRLAKVLLYQGNAEEVPPLLSGFESTGFAARYQEALGDAYYAMGDFSAAEAAYRAALADPLANQLVDGALVQMKLNDLPESAAATDDEQLDDAVDEPADGVALPEAGDADGADAAAEAPAE